MTAVYLRHVNDIAGHQLGDVPLDKLLAPQFSLPDLIGQWGVDVANGSTVDADALTGQFVYEPTRRGAIFEVIIDPSLTDGSD